MAVQHINDATAYGPGFEDMQKRIPDIRKIREAIGRSPKCSLDDILDHVIAETKYSGNGG